VVARRPLRRRAGQRGFTLIELLVAMALSTIGLLGLMALQMIAIRGNMMSRNFGEAIGIAQAQLEVAAHTAYASLSTLADAACSISGSVVSGGNQNMAPTQDQTTGNPQAIYDRCTVVTVNADNTTTLTVTVYWTDTSNTLHSVVLQTRRSP
jgi:prepilin-type N-terminal cleavage/methylation domain-containing protein